ncbi:hypothetical protein HD554DRAFT_2037711 [Boletus coccyginus]|nr:hypothetical protein HD554DRAFT_2037711 [Boletus coccyginus]
MSMPTPHNAIRRAQTSQHGPAQAGGNGESGSTKTEKGSDTKSKSTNSGAVYSTEPASNAAISGSDNEVLDVDNRSLTKRSAKVTWQLIDVAWVNSHQKHSEAAITSIHLPGGKCKLQCKPANSQQECPTETETHKCQSHEGDQLQGSILYIFGGLTDKPEKTWQPDRAQSAAVFNLPTIHQNLPEGSVAQFTKIFIPLLHLYCGTLENPWMFPDHFVDKLQELSQILGHIQCMQKIYKWHMYIGKAGINSIEDIWSTDPKYENVEECQVYIESTLSPSLPFMYSKIEYLVVNHYKLILQTFASYLKNVAAVDNNTYYKLIGNAMPLDVLVLAVTSSILRIGEGKFGEIINRTWEYCNAAVQSRQAQVSQHISAMDNTDMLDDQTLIAVSSNIDAESDGKALGCAHRDSLQNTRNGSGFHRVLLAL